MPAKPLSPESLGGIMARKHRPRGGIGRKLVKRQKKSRSIGQRLYDAAGAAAIGPSSITGRSD